MMEKRDENVIGGQKDRAILQVRKTLERCLDEIPTFPKFHLVLHREDLEDERVHLAVVNGLLGYMYLLQLYVLDYAGDHRLPYPRFLKKKGKNIFSLLSSRLLFTHVERGTTTRRTRSTPFSTRSTC